MVHRKGWSNVMSIFVCLGSITPRTCRVKR